MSCIQVTACRPFLKPESRCPSRCLSATKSCTFPNNDIVCFGTSSRLSFNVSRYKRCTTVCLFGGKGKQENGNEGTSPWKSLENAMGGLRKEKSVQDILREQMQNREFADEGGPRGPPSGGGGGGAGSGGGSDGSSGSEDEGSGGVLDEFVQVTLATIGFIFLYYYIICGDDITVLTKDYLKYIFTRKKSIRLTRVMDKWRRCYERLTRKDEVQKDWLERAIFNTPTWWYNPKQYKEYLRSRLASTSH